MGLVKLCILCIEGNLRRNLLIFILYFNCFSDQKFFYYLPPCPSVRPHPCSYPSPPAFHSFSQVHLWSSTLSFSITSPWSFLFSTASLPHLVLVLLLLHLWFPPLPCSSPSSFLTLIILVINIALFTLSNCVFSYNKKGLKKGFTSFACTLKKQQQQQLNSNQQQNKTFFRFKRRA